MDQSLLLGSQGIKGGIVTLMFFQHSKIEEIYRHLPFKKLPSFCFLRVG